MGIKKWGKGALLLATFVFWLISFPMQGFLLRVGGHDVLLEAFLFPHMLALFLTPKLFGRVNFTVIYKTSAIATAILTLLFHFISGLEPLLLPLIGLVSVGVFLVALELIRQSPRPILSAAIGLAAGNTLVVLLSRTPIDSGYKFFLIAIPLFIPIFLDISPNPAPREQIPVGLLLLLFLFYLTGGLLYGFQISLYEKNAIVPGGEVFFYITAAIAVPLLFRGKKNHLLAYGIFLGAISFTLVQMRLPLAINMGMFASQASFALMDLFTIFFVISIGTPLAYGIGFGTVCLGIGAGDLLCHWTGSNLLLLAGAGNLALIGSVIVLFCFRKKFPEPGERQPDQQSPKNETMADFGKPQLTAILERIYTPHQNQLSDQELSVLLSVLTGKTYRETARALNISESSVKTYIRRVCEKLDVTGKSLLLEKIRQTHNQFTTEGRSSAPKDSLPS